MPANYRPLGAPFVVRLCRDQNLTCWYVVNLRLSDTALMRAAGDYGQGTAPGVMLGIDPGLIPRGTKYTRHLIDHHWDGIWVCRPPIASKRALKSEPTTGIL